MYDKRKISKICYKLINSKKVKRINTYDSDEKTDMSLIRVYGVCLKNAFFAARVYAQWYLEKRATSNIISRRLENQIKANSILVKLLIQGAATDNKN